MNKKKLNHGLFTHARHTGWLGLPRVAGFTFTELMVAVSIGAVVSLGLASMMLLTSRMEKSILTQQVALGSAMKGLETVNREIHMSTLPLSVTDGNGAPVVQGNRVTFARLGEATGKRAISLVSTDNDLMTPGDNRLIFDPDTTSAGNEIVLAKKIVPLDTEGCFRYEGATKALKVRLRLGDPASGATKASNAYTGVQLQGVEINLDTAPRNNSSTQ